MINSPSVLRAFLVVPSALTTLTSTRIWEQRNVPIKGWTPGDGQAICFRSRGSGRLDYSSQLLTQSWQFKCYGQDESEADEVYRALVDRLQDAQTAGMKWAGLEVSGQLQTDPAPLSWHYTLCFFTTIMEAQIEPA